MISVSFLLTYCGPEANHTAMSDKLVLPHTGTGPVSQPAMAMHPTTLTEQTWPTVTFV